MAPSRIIGPSRPREPPLPTVAMAPRAFQRTGRGATLPPESATASISTAIPSPPTGRRPSQTIRPTSRPPQLGAATTTQRGTLRATTRRSPGDPQRTAWTAWIKPSVAMPSRPPTTPTTPISRKKMRSSRVARPKRRASVNSRDPSHSRQRRSLADLAGAAAAAESFIPGDPAGHHPRCMALCDPRRESIRVHSVVMEKFLFHKRAHSCITIPRLRRSGARGPPSGAPPGSVRPRPGTPRRNVPHRGTPPPRLRDPPVARASLQGDRTSGPLRLLGRPPALQGRHIGTPGGSF